MGIEPNNLSFGSLGSRDIEPPILKNRIQGDPLRVPRRQGGGERITVLSLQGDLGQ